MFKESNFYFEIIVVIDSTPEHAPANNDQPPSPTRDPNASELLQCDDDDDDGLVSFIFFSTYFIT